MITPATTEAWAAYHDIRRRVLYERRGRLGAYDANHPDDRSPNNFPKVLAQGSEYVGALRIDFVGEIAYLRSVAIAKPHQRKGLGRVLIRLAESFARLEGARRVESSVAPDAVSFYEKCGYQLLRTPGGTSVPMFKDLVAVAGLRIAVDNLEGPEIIALLQEHLAEMRRISPPESVHALDLAGLRNPDITFWTLWLESELAGCGALKELGRDHGEIKSMRTAHHHKRKGIATAMVRHILEEATRRGYRRLSLETGSQPHFEPARALYTSFGFQRCGPFGAYIDDPNSVFMTRAIGPG